MDIEYLLLLQSLRESLSTGWTEFFQMMTYWGETDVVPLVMATIYWCISKEIGVYLLTGWHGCRILNGFMKVTVCAYRPWIRDARIQPPEFAIKTATGYSFPSGHTMNAGALYGGLGLLQKLGKGMRVLGWTLVALVAFSRNFFGVHTPQDVLMGMLLAALVMKGTQRLMRTMKQRENADLVIATVFILLSIATAVYSSVKSYPVDYDEAGNVLVDGIAQAADTFTAVGLNIGFFAGLVLERRFVKFQDGRTLYVRVSRFMAGTLGYYLINLVLDDAIRTWLPGTPGLILSKGLVSFYIVFAFPWLMQQFEKRTHDSNMERYCTAIKKQAELI